MQNINQARTVEKPHKAVDTTKKSKIDFAKVLEEQIEKDKKGGNK